MKTKIKNLIVIIFSVVFLLLVITVFISDRLYSSTFNLVNKPDILESAIGRLDYAIVIDLLNAELYFRKYELLRKMRKINGDKKPSAGELQLLKKCIQLRLFWPKYHFFYGITLERMNQYPNAITQELILSELRKAAELKPYSEFYQNTYHKYITRLNRANRKRYLNQIHQEEPDLQRNSATLNRVHQEEPGSQKTATGIPPVKSEL
jgi:hypothetical protein